MSHKKFFIGTALVTLLSFLPGQSFSASMPASTSIEGDDSKMYISARYQLGFSAFGDEFLVKEDAAGAETKAIFGLKPDAAAGSITATDLVPYKPKYKPAYVGGGAAIGYSMGGPRAEIEGSYTIFKIEDKDFKVAENAKTILVSRAIAVADKGYTTLKNDEVALASVMLNAYYDVVSEGMPVTPYVGVGVGCDMIKWLEQDMTYKFAYQAKAGVAYALSPEIALFVDGYYHGVVGDEHKEVKVTNVAGAEATTPPGTTATVKNRLGHAGVSAGVRFSF